MIRNKENHKTPVIENVYIVYVYGMRMTLIGAEILEMHWWKKGQKNVVMTSFTTI